MIEYLIRAAEGSDWDLHLARGRLADVLLPGGWDAEPVEGWGHFRFSVAGCEVSLSAEDPGWQVSFDGVISQTTASKIVSAVAAQLERETGVTTRIVQIAGFDF